jgi:hypothetical protein
MLRTHRSLEASVMKMISFFVFHCNGAPVEWNWQGKTEVLGGGGTFLSATLSITNPTWTDPGSNPGLRRERPATDRLSHGTAKQSHCTLGCDTVMVGTVPILMFTTLRSWNLTLLAGPPRAGSGPGQKLFSGTPARADRLNICILYGKDWLSVAEWFALGLGLKGLICTIDK